MSSNVAQLNAYAATAAAALDALDFDAAILAAMKAKILLAVLPNVQRAAAGNAQQMGWSNVQAIDSFIGQCRQMKAAATFAGGGPLQQSKIVYARPAAAGDY
jgi:hypothetical protein